MSFSYGIDFGTTNSAVIAIDERTGKKRAIGETDGYPVPSVVAIKKINDDALVGRDVKIKLLSMLEDDRHIICQSVKTALDSDLNWPTATKVWTAEDIAVELFRALAGRVSVANLPPMDRAVVAIPVGMNAAKRRVLRSAAAKAGINVLGFVSEPTAAFMAHADTLRAYRNVVVFDWGGGTLDISVLEQRKGLVTERFTAGLGKAGDLVDEILARWVHEQIAEKHELNVSFDGVSATDRQLLLNGCEAAKITLQEDGVDSKTIQLGEYAGLRLVRQPVTKEEFERLVSPLVDEAIELLLTSLDKAKLAPKDTGRLLIVGGTSQLGLFQSRLRDRWEFPNLMFPDRAEWDIADGAAQLATRPGCYRTSEHVGLELCNGEFYSVIPVFTSVEDGDRKIGLGLIEDSTTASFIFATQKEELLEHTRIGELHAPCVGFSDEVITLHCRITEDLTFEASALSSHMGKKRKRPVFQFDNLRWQYDLDRQD